MTSSPFPGVDPYLQSRWSDVHAKLNAFVGEALQPMLPAGLVARTEERVLVAEGDRVSASYYPDVAVVRVGRPTTPAGGPATLTPPAPFVVEFPDQPAVVRSVQILDTRAGNRVVTAIEILSPANKAAGRLNRLYRRKLRDYDRGRVNVVEVDLLRGPRNRLRVRHLDLPAEARAAGLICVRRSTGLERWECYPVRLREPVPPVAVPLRERDAAAALDLQSLLDRTYAAGGYGIEVDYAGPPDPPLSPADAAWADALLRAAGRRA